MTNIKQQKRGGLYWKDNKPYPSVTSILSVIDKPALRYWFGQQVYIAMVANPNLTQQEALAMPYKISDKAKDRGSTIHSVVEAYEHGTKLDEKTIPPAYLGFAQAFYKWVDVDKPKIHEHEQSVFSEKYGYAGTLDLLVELNGKLYVIDAKTGKDIYPEAFLQTSAYRQALLEKDKDIAGVGVILLMENGDYKFQLSEDCEPKLKAFLACKQIWETLNEEMLKKLV